MKVEAYQVQKGDYFLYHGWVVKVIGRSIYNENDYTVENKNGKFYVSIEELEPIVVNRYTLEQAGFIKNNDNIDPIYRLNKLYVYYHTPICKAEIDKYYIESISTFSLPIGEIRMKIKHLHILQNAIRLFGEEIKLKH